MTNEELLQQLDKRFLAEREETKKIIQVEVRKAVQEETRKIVQEETKTIVQEETKKIVQVEARKIFQEETRKIVQEELEPIKKDIKLLDKRLRKLTATVDLVARFTNSEEVMLNKRVTHIENYLGLVNPTRLI